MLGVVHLSWSVTPHSCLPDPEADAQTAPRPSRTRSTSASDPECARYPTQLISRSHTSCISEAEKYQGALYRGPKKVRPAHSFRTPADVQGQAQSAPAAPAATAAVTTPLDSAASSPAPPAIHPSRLQQVENGGADESFGYSARGGPSGRGGAYGRGGRGGRGGYGAAPVQSAPPRGRGKLVSGENTRAPETGMRSWGSPAVVDDATESFASTPGVSTASAAASTADDKKKRKKKGDKGGTGAKANSKRPKEGSEAPATTAPTATTNVTFTTPANGATDEPAAKKRKRSDEEFASTAVVAATTSAEISDKTLKRLRKNASKVGEKASSALTLSDWLKQVGEGKKEQVDSTDVNRAAKVSFEDGKWVISF